MLLLAKNLGENIVRLRQLKGWTQEDLAHYADLTVASISKIERGVTNPTLKTLDKIADALGVETDSLLRF
ncbi:MAG: helix-turn-helix domain-containing protein [Anaerotruncus rubiinfantis]|jgi:transcriptional regulator with XRE-family HTH domain|uniref:helix-turn-helix domain-containing protein n=1 Tax=Anaerotruncus rubiinfantis TaxID=1720200 RepID=UPI0018982D57|nr:helix-turn-helix transcriptional regulator [Anaerotruncus rubiinfantis]